jgi:hypothetical protein
MTGRSLSGYRLVFLEVGDGTFRGLAFILKTHDT